MRVTCYVLEDGSIAEPSQVKSDAAGVLRHQDGRAVEMRGDVPRTRSVDMSAHRQMTAQQSGPGYLTRGAAAFDHDGDGKPGGSVKPADADGDLPALRAEYQAKIGKRPFPGWDAATLREKMVAAEQG